MGMSSSSNTRQARRAQIAARVVKRLCNSSTVAQRVQGGSRKHMRRPGRRPCGLAIGAAPAGLRADNAAAVYEILYLGDCGRWSGTFFFEVTRYVTRLCGDTVGLGALAWTDFV